MDKHYVVVIDATHAGYMNGNNAWYLEDHVKRAVETWVTPFHKPVLRHHDIKSDAIGHVIRAEYIILYPNNGTNRKDNRPRGVIRLTAIVSDPDAIQKIRDGRYNTVSISAEAEYARCSICDHKISSGSLCEHVRGKTYKGEKCFWYIGELRYKEVSYVNSPADEYAKTISIFEKELGKGTMTDQAKKDSEKTVKIRFTFDDDHQQTPPAGDTDVEDEWKDFTEEDIIMVNWLSVEMDNELSEDAKLSTAKRKKLSGSSFCGPNRSFPVNDCAHYTAALRLLSRYKGPGSKDRIRGCITRRGKKMGCGGAKNKDGLTNGGNQMTLVEIVQRSDVQDYVNAEVAKAVQEKDRQLTAFKALDEKIKTAEANLVDKVKEVESQKATIKTLEEDNGKLKNEIHLNLVEKVYDMKTTLQKKDVMDLKEEKDITNYKAELAKRSDASLHDSIKDLSKEDLPGKGKQIPASKPDAIEDGQPPEKGGLKIKTTEKENRAQRARDIIYRETPAQEQK